MSRLSRVGAVAFAATLLGLVAGGALAADPSPAIADPSAAPTDVPLPDLTMAPLVTLPPVVPALVEDPSLPSDGYVLGDPEAPVTIEVYADFQCPYCQRFALMEGPRIVDTWVVPGHARLVFRDFAFLGEESRWAAVAARLAAEQDHFWPFYHLLYSNLLGENLGSFTPDRLLLMGRMAGLDMEPFIAGLQVPAARATWAIIDREVRDANATRGVNATPTVFVDGVPVSTPDAATIGTAVQAALAAHGSSPSPRASVGPMPTASGLP